MTGEPTSERAAPLGDRRRRLVLMAAKGALSLGAVYVLLFVFVNFADRLLLWPQRGRVPSHGAARLGLPFAGGELEVFTARNRPSEEPRAFLLRFYGNADRADPWVAHEAGAHRDSEPLEVWGVNYPGYGASSGKATLAGVAGSALAAYDALAARAAGRPIFLLGASMGTTAALHVAANRAVAGLVLENPPPLRRLIVAEHGAWNLWLLAMPVSWQVPRELDSVANAARARAPALFVTSGADRLVPPYLQREVIDAYAGEKRAFVVPGAGHSDGMSPDVAQEVGAAFAELRRRVLAPPR